MHFALLLPAALAVGHSSALSITLTPEPNPPDFGPNVFILNPGTEPTDVDKRLEQIYETNRDWSFYSQFGEHRTAVLLMPGSHNLDINLPYYFSVIGLGRNPGATVVMPGVWNVGLRVDEQQNWMACNTFWRSIENLRMAMDNVDWFVSQGAPLRSVIIDGNLTLSGPAPDWSSGGCIANSKIQGNISMGTQQQWYTRSTAMYPYPWSAGAGSYVCVGCQTIDGQPYANSYNWDADRAQSSHTGLSYADAPEVFAEKPFIFVEGGKYHLRIPDVTNSRWGPDWESGSTVSFDRVYVARSDTATATAINEKIAAGVHVVFSPGVYILDRPIVVNHAGIVLLGLGYATLVPSFAGGALVEVGNVDGVRLAGLMLQAGPTTLATEALLRWGSEGSTYAGQPGNPGFIYDLVARAGGPDFSAVGTKYFVQINNGWVIGDNLWLWSADHCSRNAQARCIPQRYVDTALEVNGEHVQMFGLSAEHTNKDIVVWNGEKGSTMFYQAEFRYTMGLKSDPGSWTNVSRSAGYRVNAFDHKAVGFGVYAVVAPLADTSVMEPIRQDGGMLGIVVKHPATYTYGMKDINCKNWNSSWPVESKISCKAWSDSSGTCLDLEVG
ncbi:unnamed protein product [Polarella glacialis]|uniref:Uncharacterized protein n=1 Tax=Polarella glacialis TaxID=89957 RepID=A0A813KSG1_POLGL|nr:unnamed protein product [Polarella glacialis]